MTDCGEEWKNSGASAEKKHRKDSDKNGQDNSEVNVGMTANGAYYY